MKEWIPTSEIEPADVSELGTVSVRNGANIFFAAFSSVTGWHWIYPKGMEKISEPQLIFIEPQWAALHPRKSPLPREKASLKRRKSKQLLLDL